MNVEILSLCDAATESGGKLNILGAFDCIYAENMPVTHAQCAIALRTRFARIEEGDHRIRINVVDADGRAIMPSLDAGIGVRVRDGDESVVTNLILNIHQLKLEKFGRYSIDVAIDGRQEASLPVFLKPVPESQKKSSADFEAPDEPPGPEGPEDTGLDESF